MEELVTGRVTNMETGAASNFEYYPFIYDAEIMCIVKVLEVTHHDFGTNMEVNIDCLALSTHGLVFELSLVFNPETTEEMNSIVSDFVVDALYCVKGGFGIGKDFISIFEPDYGPVEQDIYESTKTAFEINGKNISK